MEAGLESGAGGEARGEAAPPVPASAVCALHPGEPALFACARCGRFTCQACVGSAPARLCTTCAPLVLDPLQLRDLPFEPTRLVAVGLGLAWGELPRLAGVALLFSLVDAAGALWWRSATVNPLDFLTRFTDVIGAQAMLALLVARTEGSVLTVGQALSQGFANWGAALKAKIGAGILTGVYALALVLPGIYKGVALSFAGIAALRTPGEPLPTSERLVEGRWWRVFGLVSLAGLGGLLVLAIPVVGLVLSSGSEEAPVSPAVSLGLGLLTRLTLDGALAGVLLAAFHALHREAGLPLPPMAWRPGLAPRRAGPSAR